MIRNSNGEVGLTASTRKLIEAQEAAANDDETARIRAADEKVKILTNYSGPLPRIKDKKKIYDPRSYGARKTKAPYAR